MQRGPVGCLERFCGLPEPSSLSPHHADTTDPRVGPITNTQLLDASGAPLPGLEPSRDYRALIPQVRGIARPCRLGSPFGYASCTRGSATRLGEGGQAIAASGNTVCIPPLAKRRYRQRGPRLGVASPYLLVRAIEWITRPNGDGPLELVHSWPLQLAHPVARGRGRVAS